jgi:hypothetical protein
MKWVYGLFVSLILDQFITWLSIRSMRKGMETPDHNRVKSWITGTIERTFFTFAIIYNLPGVLVAMIAWIAAKMVAAWNTIEEFPDIEKLRISALLGGIISMFFAMLGGLIIRGCIVINFCN